MLRTLGIGYAERDARAGTNGCARAGSFLVRAVAAYGEMAAKGPLPPEPAADAALTRAALARCGGDRR